MGRKLSLFGGVSEARGHALNVAIAGDVTVTLTPTASMLEGRLFAGSTTITVTGAATMVLAYDTIATVGVLPAAPDPEGELCSMASLEHEVLMMIGEDPDAPDVFTDDSVGMAQTRESIIDAVAEICMLFERRLEHFTIPLTGSPVYRVSLRAADVAYFISVRDLGTGRELEQTGMTSLTKEDPRWMLSRGNPRRYVPVGASSIAIIPCADSGAVECTIASIPRDYTCMLPRSLKRNFTRAVVDYAVAEFWASRGQALDAMTSLRLYARTTGLRKDDSGDRGRQRQFRQRGEHA